MANKKIPRNQFEKAKVGTGNYPAADLFGIAHDYVPDDNFTAPVKATAGAKGLAI